MHKSANLDFVYTVILVQSYGSKDLGFDMHKSANLDFVYTGILICWLQDPGDIRIEIYTGV